jgi:hypothetical protein
LIPDDDPWRLSSGDDLAKLTQTFGRDKSSQPVCLIRDPLKVSRKQNEVVIIGYREAFGQIGAGEDSNTLNLPRLFAK